jgi:hypothetical protein
MIICNRCPAVKDGTIEQEVLIKCILFSKNNKYWIPCAMQQEFLYLQNNPDPARFLV